MELAFPSIHLSPMGIVKTMKVAIPKICKENEALNTCTGFHFTYFETQHRNNRGQRAGTCCTWLGFFLLPFRTECDAF